MQQARDYALTGGGSGIITRHGKIIIAWGDQAKLYDLKSSSKSIGVTALGLALKDGKLRLDDPALRYDSVILVIPSLDIVAARAGQSWQKTSDEHYDVLKPFFEPIAQATRAGKGGHGSTVPPAGPPYPQSAVIKQVKWAPASTIVRRAQGSDNWPMTWGDDGALYTAYGDGNGFEPFVPKKLSMGLSKVTGPPENFQGVNISAQGGEFPGDGRSGRKASGLLMVDGVLYLLARNLDNAQFAWSRDPGATWRFQCGKQC